MILTKLVQKKVNLYDAYLDGVFWLSVHITDISQHKLVEEIEITSEQKELVEASVLESKLKFYLEEYTVSRVVTVSKAREMARRKLKKKNGVWYGEQVQPDVGIIEDLLDKLTELGVLSDENYATSYVKSRAQNKPRSIFLIKTELLAKGVDKSLIESVLEESSITNSELALALYSKKYKDELFEPNDQKKIRFFRGKGFGWDDIKSMMTQVNEKVGLSS